MRLPCCNVLSAARNGTIPWSSLPMMRTAVSWDHVAPPLKDRWGPGTRVPTIIVSPYAKRGFVDHTEYDTTSILKIDRDAL